MTLSYSCHKLIITALDRYDLCFVVYPRKACILESHYNLHAIVASVLLHAERPNSGLNLCGVVWGFANVVAASFEFKVSSAMSQDAIKLCQMKS